MFGHTTFNKKQSILFKVFGTLIKYVYGFDKRITKKNLYKIALSLFMLFVTCFFLVCEINGLTSCFFTRNKTEFYVSFSSIFTPA